MYIVEVGCGTGDIIGNVKTKKKIGYDIISNIVCAAKCLHPFTRFESGTFNKLVGEKIDVMIAVNFLHLFDEKQLADDVGGAIRRNKIDRIIVDEIHSPSYAYNHDYVAFFEKYGYKLEKRSRGFKALNGRKYVCIFKQV